MVVYPLLCTGNLLIQTSTYSGIATITSLPSSVLSTPSPMGPKLVCSNPELLKQEKEHLRKALTQFKYPKWALDKVEKRLNRPSSEATDGVNNQCANSTPATTREVKSKGHIVIPYTQGLCESIKKICGRYGIQTQLQR